MKRICNLLENWNDKGLLNFIDYSNKLYNMLSQENNYDTKISFPEYKYAYVMVKPDGSKYVMKIVDLIEKNLELEDIYFIRVGDWKSISEKIYDAKNEWTPHFYTTFSIYADSVNELFGNTALIILIKFKTDLYEEYLEKIYNIKKEIRMYRNKSFALVTDASKNYNENGKLPSTTLKIFNEDGSEKDPYYISSVGFHDFHALNIIHSPDPKISSIIREMKILVESRSF